MQFINALNFIPTFTKMGKQYLRPLRGHVYMTSNLGEEDLEMSYGILVRIQDVICTWPLICGSKHFIL